MSIALDVDPLDEASKVVAEVELRETPERVKESIAELRRLIEEDKTLKFDTSDDYLIMILRPTKFYPQSAYELLKRIADFRKKQADILRGISPKAEEEAFLNTEVINVLVDRDQKRRRILVMNMGSKWNPDKLNADRLFRVLYLIHLGAMMEPKTQVHGAVIIMDFNGLSWKQVKALTPSFSFRLLTLIQDAMPIRLKEVHIVLQPYIFNVIWTLFNPLIRQKLKKRIFFHGTKLKALHQYIDPSCLPENYGGLKPTIDYGSVDWYPVFAVHDDKIKEWQSYGYVDSPHVT